MRVPHGRTGRGWVVLNHEEQRDEEDLMGGAGGLRE